MIVPALVVHLYLIALPLGETAFAVRRTCGVPESLHVLTTAVLEVRLSLSGALATAAVGFCAKAVIAPSRTTKALWATYRPSGGKLVSMCTPCGEIGRASCRVSVDSEL